jgi:hypothetical protein
MQSTFLYFFRVFCVFRGSFFEEEATENTEYAEREEAILSLYARTAR